MNEKYLKLSEEQRILKNPGMYIGSIDKEIMSMYIYNESKKKIEKKMIEYTPGFLKIFDEVLVNALDHSVRDSTMTYIKVKITDGPFPELSVENDGFGINVEIDEKEKVYKPEMIFGMLGTSSNYNENVEKIVGGKHGLGSKLTNLFSTNFKVETVDSINKKKYIQEWQNFRKQEPKITKFTGKSFTRITFTPDYSKFKIEENSSGNLILLLKKRVIDCIATSHSKIKMYLNDELLKGKGLKDYINYFEQMSSKVILYDTLDFGRYKWEYAILDNEGGEFEQISFVNGICTSKGGKHVDSLMYNITSALKTKIESIKKNTTIKSYTIKNNMMLFLNAVIVNPSFPSQSKEELSTNASEFFGKYKQKIEIPENVIHKLYKSEIVKRVLIESDIKDKMALKKTDGTKKRRVLNPKLDDANWAGTSKSNECSLFITEGLSASKFAKDGMVLLGTDKYGVFSLKGKVLNIRDASIEQMMKNVELNDLKEIIGLKENMIYSTEKELNTLRYRHLIILTDSDEDGVHICALLINFIHYKWPELLNNNFIFKMITPIIVYGKDEFYTKQDYLEFLKNKSAINTKLIKYYKGLGTWEESKTIKLFEKFNNLLVSYNRLTPECDNSMLLAFEKDKNVKKTKKEGENLSVKMTDKRKEWLSKYNKNDVIHFKNKKRSLKDLINKELIHFSIYDNTRSIPNFVDGLKPSQRKILWYLLKRNQTSDIKVAQLSGYVAAESSYHHGEMSLQKTIIGMAQNFTGSNNINLLYPSGNFGTRNMNGQDAASPRYIYTRLQKITNLIFHNDDWDLLNFLEDDGNNIEPEFFVPVLPMILINGCEGIGTGYSTNIPCYSPKQIINILLQLLENPDDTENEINSTQKLIPYYNNFTGKIEKSSDNSGFSVKGIYQRINDTQIFITELPINIKDYKEFLINKINNKQIKDFTNETKNINKEIKLKIEFNNKEQLDKLISDNLLEKEFKLVSKININNMYVFDEDSKIIKYQSPTDILLDFFDIRIHYYKLRKEHLLKKLKYDLMILINKIKFINEYIDGTLLINKQTKDNIIKQLQDKKFNYDSNGDYNYLLNQSIISLTKEKIQNLKEIKERKQNEVESLQKMTVYNLWKNDLLQIQNELN